MLLLIHSFPGANECFERHYPYFQKSGANQIVGIGTVDGKCRFPDGCEWTNIGEDKYISGRHLPQRLVDTIKFGLTQKEDHICVCEVDTVFFNRLPIVRMESCMAAHYAGGPTWSSKAKGFFHNPWLLTSEIAEKFVEVAQETINSGVCDRSLGQPDPPEASPDVFVGLVTDIYNIPIQGKLWREYSRNSLDVPGHLEEARQAYKDGYEVVHGIKTQKELEYILS